jgi:AhpD family alkylhydroperoxidase
MRLELIERPRSLLMRLAGWSSRRQLGAVISPLKVIYARAPALAVLSHRISRTLERKLSLDPELALLVTTQSSLLNGCGFCADLHRAQAVRARLGREKFRDLLQYASSPHFDERGIVELTWLNAVGNYFNLLAAPLEIGSDGLEALALQRTA